MAEETGRALEKREKGPFVAQKSVDKCSKKEMPHVLVP